MLRLLLSLALATVMTTATADHHGHKDPAAHDMKEQDKAKIDAQMKAMESEGMVHSDQETDKARIEAQMKAMESEGMVHDDHEAAKAE